MTRASWLLGAPLLLSILGAAACSDDATPANGSSSPNGSTTGPDGGVPPGAPGASGTPPGQTDPAAKASTTNLAQRLRGKAQFMVGMGNDLANNHDEDGAYTVGTPLDLHYAYLVGLPGQGGWPDWNPDGSFVNVLADAADRHGATPMYTLYAMAAWGENNMDVLENDGFMGPYLAGAKLLFQRLAMFDKPAMVQLEPDFWAFAQLSVPDGKHVAHVKALAPECASLTDDLSGFAKCIVTLGRTYAPKVAIGFHASSWAGSTESIITYLKNLGADSADFITTDMLDRDAGCFEVHTDPNCQRGGKTGWYWDETNATSPNFHEQLAGAKAIHEGLGLPIMWWQVPFGVPSDTPGSAGHYRDNKVHYFFAHVDEFVAAGGFAAAFGTGAGNQTYITTDGDQFKNAVAGYFAHPAALP